MFGTQRKDGMSPENRKTSHSVYKHLEFMHNSFYTIDEIL